MVINGNIYNHLSSSLVPKKRKTTHKASDLKAIYNNMAKYNKNSPLYLMDFSESKQSYIINIKEAAITLKDTADIFSDADNTLYSSRTFRSDNDSAVTGSIKSGDLSNLPAGFSIGIDHLATEQVNIGEYIDSEGQDFFPKKHSFTMSTPGGTANFSISVASGDTNLMVQQKVADAINERHTGVTASIINSGDENALMISSNETGASGTADGLQFSFKSAATTGQNMVEMLGLNNVSTEASNSVFSINGEAHTSASNHIAINHIVELDFHETTDKDANISFVPDTKIAKEQVDAFVSAYNTLVDLSKNEGTINLGTRSLARDIKGIAGNHIDELSKLGITVDEDGKMIKDDSIVSQNLENGSFDALFSDISDFKNDMVKATDRLTIDPMAYVNKLIVTYPNKANKFDTPYTQSLYSGLIYNNYA
jgi:flagellar hook-associated protein 2